MSYDMHDVRRERVSAVLTKSLERVPHPSAHRSCGVSQGAALHALFLHEMALSLGRPDLMDRARDHILAGAELLNAEALSTSLYRSAPGYAWVLNTLAEDGSLPWAYDFLCDLDELLADSLEASEDALNIDLINGVAGILVYVMTRGNAPGAGRLVRAIEGWFRRRFAYWEDGYAVQSSMARAKSDQDLGIAHGVPGVLAAFGLAMSKGLFSEDTGRLLLAGYDYIWASANPSPSGDAYFPAYNGGIASARVAWCYGSLGSCVAYLHNHPMQPSNHKRAHRLIRHAISQYDSPDHGIKDVSLCHGEAGVALLLSTISRCEQVENALRVSCERWSHVALDRTLDAAEFRDVGVSFPYYTSKSGFIEADSFLEGWVGVCLAMSAVVKQASPRWTELLLLSDLT